MFGNLCHLRSSSVVALPKLGRVSYFRVDAVVEKDESEEGQDAGHEDLGPVSAEHDVPLVSHDLGGDEQVLVVPGIRLVQFFRPELEKSADVDRPGVKVIKLFNFVADDEAK